MLIIQNLISSQKKSKQIHKKKSFVIVNDDHHGGYLVKNIVSSMRSSGLVEQDARFGSKRAKNIKLFDAIVVGDSNDNTYFDYDFRVVKHKQQNTLDDLDGRAFKVFSVINDYHAILNKISEYAKANNSITPCGGGYQSHGYGFKPKKRKSQPKHVNVTVKFKEEAQPVFAAKNVVSVKRLSPIQTTEKCTFFDDWVKIGMHQFDVEWDCLGNQFISDAKLNRYYIREDRTGRRFLVTQ